MHFCSDELMALMAILPGLSLILAKARAFLCKKTPAEHEPECVGHEVSLEEMCGEAQMPEMKLKE